jgi:hypothetical protein
MGDRRFPSSLEDDVFRLMNQRFSRQSILAVFFCPFAAGRPARMPSRLDEAVYFLETAECESTIFFLKSPIQPSFPKPS